MSGYRKVSSSWIKGRVGRALRGDAGRALRGDADAYMLAYHPEIHFVTESARHEWEEPPAGNAAFKTVYGWGKRKVRP